MDSNPPLLHHYGALLHHTTPLPSLESSQCCHGLVMEECQLPLIDLNGLNSHYERERVECAMAISKASTEWGFFQVVNHGIRPQLLKDMRREQTKLFQTPFELKASCRLLNDSYRWGTPTATRPNQFSWSEAFHIPLTKISEETCYGQFGTLRYYYSSRHTLKFKAMS